MPEERIWPIGMIFNHKAEENKRPHAQENTEK